MLDELELSVSGGSTGSVTTPEDVRSKRTKGRDYPLAAASSLGEEVGPSRPTAFARLSDRQDPGRSRGA